MRCIRPAGTRRRPHAHIRPRSTAELELPSSTEVTAGPHQRRARASATGSWRQAKMRSPTPHGPSPVWTSIQPSRAAAGAVLPQQRTQRSVAPGRCLAAVEEALGMLVLATGHRGLEGGACRDRGSAWPAWPRPAPSAARSAARGGGRSRHKRGWPAADDQNRGNCGSGRRFPVWCVATTKSRGGSAHAGTTHSRRGHGSERARPGLRSGAIAPPSRRSPRPHDSHC